MSHWSLTDYYVYIDIMVSDHGYTKYDIDNMMPFERDVLIHIVNERVERKKKAAGEGGQWEVQTEAPT